MGAYPPLNITDPYLVIPLSYSWLCWHVSTFKHQLTLYSIKLSLKVIADYVAPNLPINTRDPSLAIPLSYSKDDYVGGYLILNTRDP